MLLLLCYIRSADRVRALCMWGHGAGAAGLWLRVGGCEGVVACVVRRYLGINFVRARSCGLPAVMCLCRMCGLLEHVVTLKPSCFEPGTAGVCAFDDRGCFAQPHYVMVPSGPHSQLEPVHLNWHIPILCRWACAWWAPPAT